MTNVDSARAIEKRAATMKAINEALAPLINEKGILAVNVICLVAIPEGVAVPVVTMQALNADLLNAVGNVTSMLAKGQLEMHAGEVTFTPIPAKN